MRSATAGKLRALPRGDARDPLRRTSPGTDPEPPRPGGDRTTRRRPARMAPFPSNRHRRRPHARRRPRCRPGRSQGGPMTHTIYYTATSLDGFIATPEHSLDWLLTRDNDPAGPMGYDSFITEVGAVVMGASTYAWLGDNYDGPWPYDVPCWVLTHRNFPARDDGDVRFI